MGYLSRESTIVLLIMQLVIKILKNLLFTVDKAILYMSLVSALNSV